MQVTRYSDDVIYAQRTHGGIMHQSLTIQFEFASSLCRWCFAKQWTNLGSALAQLSLWLMVSYCDRWTSVVCRQQLLKKTSPPKLLIYQKLWSVTLFTISICCSRKKGFGHLFTFIIKALLYTYVPSRLAHFTHSASIVWNWKPPKVIGQRSWYIYTCWILTKLAEMILLWPSLIIVQIVPVHCISRPHRLKIDFQDENFKKSSRLKPQGLQPWYLVCSIT